MWREDDKEKEKGQEERRDEERASKWEETDVRRKRLKGIRKRNGGKKRKGKTGIDGKRGRQ